MAFDPQGEIPNRDTTSLRVELDGIYQQLSHGPRDRTQELTRIQQDAERVRGFLERERDLAHKAEKQLSSMGALARARRKSDVEQLRGRIRNAGKAEDRFTENLLQLGDEEKGSIGAQKERERWVEEQAPLIERAQHIENELSGRNRALLRDRENALPKYLETSVGAVPERPSERNGWRESVLAIEDYRDRYEIKDQHRALGGEPRKAEQRLDKERVERTVEETNDKRLGRSRESDVGLELSREL